MKDRTATHMLTLNGDGTSHIRQLQNTPPAPKPEPSRATIIPSKGETMTNEHVHRAAENRRLAARLEREADRAKAAGRDARAAELYQASSDVYRLAELDQRDHARQVAADMDIGGIMDD